MARSLIRFGVILTLLCLSAMPAMAQTTRPAGDLFALPPPTDNAALDYWRAIALLGDRPAGLEAAVLDTNISPTIALAAGKKLDAQDPHPFAEEVRALHRGAGKPGCNFDPPIEEGIMCALPHLNKLRELARRAVFEAKVHQAQGHHREAAQILADTIQMGLHVGGRGAMIEGAVGASAAGEADRALAWLLSGQGTGANLDAETAGHLLGRLNRMQPARFDAAAWLRLEAACFGGGFIRLLSDGWDVKDASQRRAAVKEFLATVEMLRDIGTGGPAMPKAAQRRLAFQLYADLGSVPTVVAGWRAQYAPLMAEAVKLAGMPYEQAIPGLNVFKMQVLAIAKEPTRNPLVTLMPEYNEPVFLAAVANARLAMRRIQAAAVLTRLRTGKYPADLAAMRAMFPAGLPADPFTGKDFDYRLKDGKPVIRSTWQPADQNEKRQMPAIDMSK